VPLTDALLQDGGLNAVNVANLHGAKQLMRTLIKSDRLPRTERPREQARTPLAPRAAATRAAEESMCRAAV
jgi:hypothetical protein